LAPESGDALAAAAQAAAERPGTRALVPAELVAALGRHVSPLALRTLVELVERRSVAPSGVLRVARELTARNLTARRARDADVGVVPSADDLEHARLRLAAQFADESASRRRAVAALYAALADADSAGPLAALVDDHDALVREEVARSLGRLPRLDARAVLSRLSADPSEGVRVAALEGLSDEPRDAVRDLALRAARDASAAVRSAAVALLTGDDTDSARGALARLEVDDSARVRGAVRRLRSRDTTVRRGAQPGVVTESTTEETARTAQ
jgi:hypothetical protein